MTVIMLHALVLIIAAAVVLGLDRSVGSQRAAIGAGLAGLFVLLVASGVLRVRDVEVLDAWLAGAGGLAMGWLLIIARRKAIVIAAALGAWSGLLIVLLRLGWVGRTTLRGLLGF